jgi:hypothetical protein
MSKNPYLDAEQAYPMTVALVGFSVDTSGHNFGHLFQGARLERYRGCLYRIDPLSRGTADPLAPLEERAGGFAEAIRELDRPTVVLAYCLGTKFAQCLVDECTKSGADIRTLILFDPVLAEARDVAGAYAYLIENLGSADGGLTRAAILRALDSVGVGALELMNASLSRTIERSLATRAISKHDIPGLRDQLLDRYSAWLAFLIQSWRTAPVDVATSVACFLTDERWDPSSVSPTIRAGTVAVASGDSGTPFDNESLRDMVAHTLERI